MATAVAEAPTGEQLRFEGMVVDIHELAFGGSITLEPTAEHDRHLLGHMRLGETVELRVIGIVTDRAARVALDREELHLGDVKAKAKLRIHSVYTEAGERIGVARHTPEKEDEGDGE